MRIGTRTLKITAWLSLAAIVGVLTVGALSLRGLIEISFGVELKISIAGGGSIYIIWAHPPIDWASVFNLDVSWYSSAGGQNVWWPKFVREYYWDGLFLPPWVPALVFLSIGVPAFVTLRRRACAMKNSACPKCGYMLTGLPPDTPCPECGRAQRG